MTLALGLMRQPPNKLERTSRISNLPTGSRCVPVYHVRRVPSRSTFQSRKGWSGAAATMTDFLSAAGNISTGSTHSSPLRSANEQQSCLTTEECRNIDQIFFENEVCDDQILEIGRPWHPASVDKVRSKESRCVSEIGSI